MNACVLEHQIQSRGAIQMLIWQVTLITENSLLDICLFFQGELYHDNQSCRSVLHCLQLKQSILRLLKLAER